jgi:hypothetical protein
MFTFDRNGVHDGPEYAAKAGAVVKIELSNHQAIEIVGAISDRDVKRAEQLVARNAQFLKLEWEKLHARF